MKTATKQIKFNELMKVFAKYVSKSETRPVLKCVYFDGKYLAATNSHIMLRVDVEYVTDMPEEFKEGCLYDPKEMKFEDIQTKYPEINRIVPKNSSTTIELNKNIKDLHKEVKEAKRAIEGRRDKIIRLNFTAINTIVSSKEFDKKGSEVQYSNTIESVAAEGENVTISLNSKYLDNALEHVKKLSKLSHKPVTFNLNGKMRPALFKQENVFDLILMPIRENINCDSNITGR